MPHPDDTQVAITIELRKAVSLLGANPDEVLPIGINSGFIYRIFGQLGAKADLLEIIGSWGQSGMPDESVLEQLTIWNERPAGR